MISLCVASVYVGGGKTNGVDGASSPRRSPAVQRGESPSVVDDEPAPEDALRISSIDVHTNCVGISLSFPTNLVDEGNTIDVLFNRELSANGWEWATNRIVCADDIGTDGVGRVEFSLGYGMEIPDGLPRLFFKASVRETVAVTAADGDGDGIPDVYELFHGTNPYVGDYELAPKVTVGANGDYPTIRAALAASGRYSIVELTEDVNEDIPIQMPPHPVMVTGPTNGYAVVRGKSAPGVFILSDGQDERTVFRNLYLLLDAKTNFQSGFWVGGNLPWFGTGAGGTFRNVRIRMPHPQIEYFGWHFYRYTCVTSEISRCVVDASGAGWAFGVYGMDPPPLAIDGCSFLNFASGGAHDGIGICLLNSQFGLNQGDPAAISLRNTLFDDSFAGAVPIVRFDGDAGVTLSLDNCLMPTNSIYGDPPEEQNKLVITNALVSHFGHPLPESPAVGLGVGALEVFQSNGLDTDGDGLNDYDEVYVHGTDPWLSDTDCDGLADSAELAHGTDPADSDSFYRAITYSITGCGGIDNVTNRVCWSASPDGWQGANEVREFDMATSSGAYDVITDTGTIYLKVYRDLNRNGVYDSGIEPMIACGIGLGVNVAHIDAVFGDVDGDRITDLQEYADGTSPTDGGEYAFNLDLTYTDVFKTTNSLTFSVKLGSTFVYPPTVVTNRTWHQDFVHLVTITGENAVVSAWDDANSNQLWDEVETGNRYTIHVKGHDTVLTNRMSYGDFDRDRNNLPDWWEIHTGLAGLECSHTETDDNDHDGLINLHEYWAGSNPLSPDGSNTFLSVCARAIDDRIQGVTASNAVPRFLNYFENAAQQRFVINPDFWLTNVDVGCVSVWHGVDEDVGSKNATAITRRHVIMSRHWNVNQYDFCDTNGNVVTRRVVDWFNVPNSDILLGRLSEDLPASIKPSKVLDLETVRLLANLKYIPAVCLNQDKAATVLEMASLDTSIVNSNTGRRYYHLGMCNYTNNVSMARCAIRGATPPGNSSCPVFFLAGDDLVLLCTWHMGNPNAYCWSNFYGPVVSYWLDEIQNKINQWEGNDVLNYQIEILNRNDYDDLRIVGGGL